jgi:LacI family transcriptional regulator
VPPRRSRPSEEVEVASIREVAKRSGVSVATVSRVLNGTAPVSEAVRERVLESARTLDYAPSAAARTLVRRRSQLIGVALFTGADHPALSQPFVQDVLVGIGAATVPVGYDILLLTGARECEPLPASFLQRARAHHVDGLVLLGVDRHDPALVELLHSTLPAVAIDIEVSGPRTGFVASDSVDGARCAVRHLHELGHTRIATIAGLPWTKPGGDRLAGFRAELAELGLECPDAYVREGDFYLETGTESARALLGLPERPTAIFAASDLMAAGAVQAAREAGLRVPEDVSIVGFDDVQLAQLLDPPLTTIRQDRAGLGAAAAGALLELVADAEAEPPARTLPVELVVRGSTAAPPRG